MRAPFAVLAVFVAIAAASCGVACAGIADGAAQTPSPAQRAAALLANMTQAEKLTLMHGVSGPYIGNVVRVLMPRALRRSRLQRVGSIPRGTSMRCQVDRVPSLPCARLAHLRVPWPRITVLLQPILRMLLFPPDPDTDTAIIAAATHSRRNRASVSPR